MIKTLGVLLFLGMLTLLISLFNKAQMFWMLSPDENPAGKIYLIFEMVYYVVFFLAFIWTFLLYCRRSKHFPIVLFILSFNPLLYWTYDLLLSTFVFGNELTPKVLQDYARVVLVQLPGIFIIYLLTMRTKKIRYAFVH